MCSGGRQWVCSSQASSTAAHATAGPVFGHVLPCKSSGEAEEGGSSEGRGTGGEQRESERGGDEDSHRMSSHHMGEGKWAYFRAT